MEIIRSSLDGISRPASSEQTGSRVCSVSLAHGDRISSTTPFSLVVLTNDAADQIQSSSEENKTNSSTRCPGKDHSNSTERNNEEYKLQRATEEMRRLDEILSAKICKEKKARSQRKELQAMLWQELMQNKPEGHSESAHEALNTRQFLALEALTGADKEDDFVPVFETQVPDCEHERDNQCLEKCGKRADHLTESFDVSCEDSGEAQFPGSHRGSCKGKKKHKDFVKRNIERVSSEGGQVLLTPAEQERLAELLQEIDEEEEDRARGADGEDPGSEVGWKCDGDPQPGEKVLQDIKEWRGQERRLHEIQQQLEILGQSQEMTNESPEITEKQLLSLLDECELTESWDEDLKTTETRP